MNNNLEKGQIELTDPTLSVTNNPQQQVSYISLVKFDKTSEFPNDFDFRYFGKAFLAHENVNQKYDGYPYSVHLMTAFYFGLKYIELIPIEFRADILTAILFHDVLEDCRLTVNDLEKLTNSVVAELVYAVTEEKGRNRAERHSDKFFKELFQVSFAPFVKLCDNLANIS